MKAIMHGHRMIKGMMGSGKRQEEYFAEAISALLYENWYSEI